MTGPRVSVVLALRDDSPGQDRIRLWDFIRMRLQAEHPEYEIVIGTDDGIDPFHKTLALNRAAAQARGDVLVLTDTDTWVPPAFLDAAVAGVAQDPSRWWRPYSRKVKLLGPDTERALVEGLDWRFTYDPRRRYEKNTTFSGAPPLVVPRAMYETVAGFDERFVGWGSEDVAFVTSLQVLFGPPVVLSGEVVHLWHPRIGRSGHDLWPGQVSASPNQRLAAEYRRARIPTQMRELIASRSQVLTPSV